MPAVCPEAARAVLRPISTGVLSVGRLPLLVEGDGDDVGVAARGAATCAGVSSAAKPLNENS